MINYEVFEPLVNHLKSIGPFLFRPNSGNGGDAVIALSCMEIFDTHGLDWQMFTHDRYEKCKSIVYSGGATFPRYFHYLILFPLMMMISIIYIDASLF